MATVMMDAGWSPAQLRHVITSRPLPHAVRTSVGAIIAARLRAAQAYPPPATAASPHDDPCPDTPLAPANTERSSTASAARTVTEALTYRASSNAPGAACPQPPPARTSAPPASAGRCAAAAQAPPPAAPTPAATAAARHVPPPLP
ncbi:hypothetical protein ACFWWR_33185, partial [Streptomyces sp. NPDC058678]